MNLSRPLPILISASPLMISMRAAASTRPPFFARTKKGGKENTPPDLPSASLQVPCASRGPRQEGTKQSAVPRVCVSRIPALRDLCPAEYRSPFREKAERCPRSVATSSFRAGTDEERREPVRRIGGAPGQMVLGTFAETKVPRHAGAGPRIQSIRSKAAQIHKVMPHALIT